MTKNLSQVEEPAQHSYKGLSNPRKKEEYIVEQKLNLVNISMEDSEKNFLRPSTMCLQ